MKTTFTSSRAVEPSCEGAAPSLPFRKSSSGAIHPSGRLSMQQYVFPKYQISLAISCQFLHERVTLPFFSQQTPGHDPIRPVNSRNPQCIALATFKAPSPSQRNSPAIILRGGSKWTWLLHILSALQSFPGRAACARVTALLYSLRCPPSKVLRCHSGPPFCIQNTTTVILRINTFSFLVFQLKTLTSTVSTSTNPTCKILHFIPLMFVTGRHISFLESGGFVPLRFVPCNQTACFNLNCVEKSQGGRVLRLFHVVAFVQGAIKRVSCQ